MSFDTQRVLLGYGVAVALVYALVVVAQHALGALRPRNYPPGPPALPFIGSAHHFAGSKAFLRFAEWRRTYGDVIGLKVGRGNLVVVNSAAVARELYERRWAVYSGRPVSESVRAVIGASGHIVAVQNDAGLRKWRTSGRLLVGQGESSRQQMPSQDAASAALVQRLLRDPARFLAHLRNWSLVAPLLAICGLRSGDWDEEAVVAKFFDTQRAWLKFLEPGNAPLVDLFPALRFVPESLGAGWKRTARAVRGSQREFYYMLLDMAKKEKARNDEVLEAKKKSKKKSKNKKGAPAATDEKKKLEKKEKEGQQQQQQQQKDDVEEEEDDDDDIRENESLMARLLRMREDEAAQGKAFDNKKLWNDDDLAFFGGSFLDGAVDTTHSAILGFVKALAAHPHVLKRAQDEVDAVCGDRVPDNQDLPKLPYLKACFFELLRWRPPTPMTLPHRMDADDVVEGYFLPKGTVVLQNTWAINHDPETHDRPEAFDPDRYLRASHGTVLTPEQARERGRKSTYIFGSGRRACPGDQFAQKSVLIAVSKIVWALGVYAPESSSSNDDKEKDGGGGCGIDLSIETGYHDGLVQAPNPFEARFVSRGADRAARIDEAVAAHPI